MRIFHTIDSAGLYGAEAVLLGLAGEQQRRGDRPVIVSIAPPGSVERALESACRRAGLPCMPFRMRDGLNLRGARELLAVLAAESADMIHSHGYKTNILFAGARRVGHAPRIATLHGWTARRKFSKLGMYRWLDQMSLPRLDGVVVVTQAMLDLPVVRRIDPARVAFIPNGLEGIENPPQGPAATAGDSLVPLLSTMKREGKTLVGAIGRLSAEKNVTLLLEAVHRLSSEFPGLCVVVIGEGPESERLKQSVSRLGLQERVVFAGFRTDVRGLLPRLDLLALPSLTEGLPMILLEAIAARRPVVATSVGEIPRVLEKEGYLAPPGDIDAFCEALALALRNPAEASLRATRAQERVARDYSVGGMTDRYAAFYGKIAGIRQ